MTTIITSNPKPVVAVDCDEVLFPLHKLVIQHAAENGHPFEYDDIKAFDYGQIHPQVGKLAIEVFKRPDLYDEHEPADDVMKGLRELSKEYRVIAVSSPFSQHAHSKWRFLQRHGFAHKDIFLTGDKRMVRFDVLIDDRPETILSLQPWQALVFDRPWNQGLDGYRRAFNWKDAPEHVHHMIRGGSW